MVNFKVLDSFGFRRGYTSSRLIRHLGVGFGITFSLGFSKIVIADCGIAGIISSIETSECEISIDVNSAFGSTSPVLIESNGGLSLNISKTYLNAAGAIKIKDKIVKSIRLENGGFIRVGASDVEFSASASQWRGIHVGSGAKVTEGIENKGDIIVPGHGIETSGATVGLIPDENYSLINSGTIKGVAPYFANNTPTKYYNVSGVAIGGGSLIGGILNDGDIFGTSRGITIFGTVSMGNVFNASKGKITGADYGIAFHTDVNQSGLNVLNSGLIEGTGVRIDIDHPLEGYGVGVFGNSIIGNIVNHGSGVISGPKAGIHIASGSSLQSIENHGRIEGNYAIKNDGGMVGRVTNAGFLNGHLALGSADLMLTGSASTSGTRISGNTAAGAVTLALEAGGAFASEGWLTASSALRFHQGTSTVEHAWQGGAVEVNAAPGAAAAVVLKNQEVSKSHGVLKSTSTTAALQIGGSGGDSRVTLLEGGRLETGSGRIAIGAGGVLQIGADRNSTAGSLSANNLNQLIDAKVIDLRDSSAALLLNFTVPTTAPMQVDMVIAGTGQLVQQAGHTLLSAANTYSGTTLVEQGTLQAGMAGAFSAASKHTVSSGARLDLQGHDQQIAGMDLRAGGRVLVGGMGRAGTTLTTTEPWQGGGAVHLNTVFLGDGAASDRLVFDGAAAVVTGTTRLVLSNVSVSRGGAQNSDNGIEVVTGRNGAITTAQSSKDGFVLDDSRGYVSAGAFQYRLYAADRHGVGQNWYLRPTVGAGFGGEALAYRAEVPLVAAVPVQLRYADMGMLVNLHQRQGDTGSVAPRLRDTWARTIQLEPRLQQTGEVSPHSAGNVQGWQAGVDLYADGGVKTGLYVGQLQGDLNVVGSAGGQYQPVGFNRLHSHYLGLYGTATSEQGRYLDVVLQKGLHRSGLQSAGDSSADMRGHSWQLSAEWGVPWKRAAAQWTLEPQLQLVYRRMRLDDLALVNAKVTSRADSDLLLRVGVRMAGRWSTGVGVFQPYARINWWLTTPVKDVARFSPGGEKTEVASRMGTRSAEAALGGAWWLSPSVRLYAEVGRSWGLSGAARVGAELQGSLGLKVHW